jgi:hypothetical protein
MSMSILLYVFSVTKYEFFVLAFSGVTICVDRVVFKLISTYLIPMKSKWICGNQLIIVIWKLTVEKKSWCYLL